MLGLPRLEGSSIREELSVGVLLVPTILDRYDMICSRGWDRPGTTAESLH
jgi:hypothetical protein